MRDQDGRRWSLGYVLSSVGFGVVVGAALGGASWVEAGPRFGQWGVRATAFLLGLLAVSPLVYLMIAVCARVWPFCVGGRPRLSTKNGVPLVHSALLGLVGSKECSVVAEAACDVPALSGVAALARDLQDASAIMGDLLRAVEEEFEREFLATEEAVKQLAQNALPLLKKAAAARQTAVVQRAGEGCEALRLVVMSGESFCAATEDLYDVLNPKSGRPVAEPGMTLLRAHGCLRRARETFNLFREATDTLCSGKRGELTSRFVDTRGRVSRP